MPRANPARREFDHGYAPSETFDDDGDGVTDRAEVAGTTYTREGAPLSPLAWGLLAVAVLVGGYAAFGGRR